MTKTQPSATKPLVTDAGKLVLDAGLRLPSAPAHVADSGKIRLGAGLRLPPDRTAA